tara:strand:- start:304 stop:480 length:177 start_codon:yes stop_codon:yes gene_type:complete
LVTFKKYPFLDLGTGRGQYILGSINEVIPTKNEHNWKEVMRRVSRALKEEFVGKYNPA